MQREAVLVMQGEAELSQRCACGLMERGRTAVVVHLERRYSGGCHQHQDGPRLLLNRLNGTPLLPVEERSVPQTDIPGEVSWPTQPFSTIALVPEGFVPGDAWGLAPEDAKWCQDKIKA